MLLPSITNEPQTCKSITCRKRGIFMAVEGVRDPREATPTLCEWHHLLLTSIMCTFTLAVSCELVKKKNQILWWIEDQQILCSNLSLDWNLKRSDDVGSCTKEMCEKCLYHILLSVLQWSILRMFQYVVTKKSKLYFCTEFEWQRKFWCKDLCVHVHSRFHVECAFEIPYWSWPSLGNKKKFMIGAAWVSKDARDKPALSWIYDFL